MGRTRTQIIGTIKTNYAFKNANIKTQAHREAMGACRKLAMGINSLYINSAKNAGHNVNKADITITVVMATGSILLTQVTFPFGIPNFNRISEQIYEDLQDLYLKVCEEIDTKLTKSIETFKRSLLKIRKSHNSGNSISVAIKVNK